MRIGSLCSGIGGLELGLEWAGLGHTVWQAEYDPHASTIFDRHWDVPNYGDITKLPFDDMEPVDVLCAGYPCQPFSQAGQRKGTDDARHLWPAVRDAVGRLRPGLVVLENVRGHLSLGFDRVVGDLAVLGYDAEWCLLRASDVGGCHQRARLFVAAYPSDIGRERVGETWGRWPGPADDGGAVADAEGTERGTPQPDPVGTAVGRTPEPGERPGTAWGPYRPAIERWERALGRPAPAPTTDGRLNPAFVEWMMGYPEGWVDGLNRSAALRCLGNSVVPQVAERFGRMVRGASPTSGRLRFYCRPRLRRIRAGRWRATTTV